MCLFELPHRKDNALLPACESPPYAACPALRADCGGAGSISSWIRQRVVAFSAQNSAGAPPWEPNSQHICHYVGGWEASRELVVKRSTLVVLGSLCLIAASGAACFSSRRLYCVSSRNQLGMGRKQGKAYNFNIRVGASPSSVSVVWLKGER